MNQRSLLGLFALALALPLAAKDIHELNQSLSPGINLGNTLEVPADGSWTDVVKADPKMIDRIAEQGFASVRVPIRWSDYAADTPPYTIQPQFFKLVDSIVDRALDHDLKVIINVHHYNEFYEDPYAELPQFLAIWQQVAQHYEGYDRDELFFEILNEPHGNMTQELWEAIYPPALMIIRQENEDRPVLMGGSPWNGWQTLADLDWPKNDDNLIATFHYYLPFEFTHQGAEWLEEPPPVGTRFTDSIEELVAMSSHFAQVKAWADGLGVPVCVGEFGAYSTADMESRVAYTRTVREMCEAFGFSWHYWEFASGFGIYDPQTGKYRTGLRDALLKDAQ
ncbi:MAG: glycoside hydrolase family 5 protein [Verrucomicrobiota bacterium JB022]|nr:glycoside hydrolase family 5 protein [Verrucomicrobiota bacterium JB022]